MGDSTLLRFFSFLLVISFFSGKTAWAKTENGNELALYITEAKSPSEYKPLIDNALTKQHLFRYLKIYSIEKGQSKAGPMVSIVALEPSSSMNIQFTVRKTQSILKLMEDPETKVNDCIAVIGVVASADKDKNVIVLNPVIVRNKDRSAPKAGKEFLYEVDASATAYSFTGGDEPVNLSKQDMDLLQFKSQYYGAGDTKGKKAWANFLLKEIAKREKERRAKAFSSFKRVNGQEGGEGVKTNKQEEVAPQSNIVDDPE